MASHTYPSAARGRPGEKGACRRVRTARERAILDQGRLPGRTVIAMPSSVRTEPLPAGPWLMQQTWSDLLFAHWRVPPEALRRLLPPALEVETFDGSAWLGVVPFQMSGVRPRLLPPLPRL